jgi:hypothetical protein
MQKNLWDKVETRMGTTILHFMLSEGARLVHLDLERCACDSLLKLLATSAPNLKYLNINRSVVSDEGLLYLCGLEKDWGKGTRERLSRSCKEEKVEEMKLVVNDQPKWIKKMPGCQKLTHLKVGKDPM